MSDRRKSILDKLFDCVNNGVEWGVSQVKNPCPPRKKIVQKDTNPSSEADSPEKIDSEVELESQTRMRIEGPDSRKGLEGGPDFQRRTEEVPDSQRRTEEDPDSRRRLEEGPDSRKRLEEGPDSRRRLEDDPAIQKRMEKDPDFRRRTGEDPQRSIEQDPSIQKRMEEDPNFQKRIEEDPDFRRRLEQDPHLRKRILEEPVLEERDTRRTRGILEEHHQGTKEGPDTRMRIGEGADTQNEKANGKYSPCQPGGPYLTPDQICPNLNEPPCCVITMQDPCRPCCCEPTEKQAEEEENLEPCPPKKSYLDEPREPTCSCDFCKNNVRGKSCKLVKTHFINNGKVKETELRIVEMVENNYSQEKSMKNDIFPFGWKFNIFVKVPRQKMEEYGDKEMKQSDRKKSSEYRKKQHSDLL